VYRSRPKGRLDKEILEFLSSMHDDLQLLQYDVLGSEAHVVMLNKIGVLTLHETKALLAALEEARHNPEKLTTRMLKISMNLLSPILYRKSGSR